MNYQEVATVDLDFIIPLLLILKAGALCAAVIGIGIKSFRENTLEKRVGIMLAMAVLALALLLASRSFIP